MSKGIHCGAFWLRRLQVHSACGQDTLDIGEQREGNWIPLRAFTFLPSWSSCFSVKSRYSTQKAFQVILSSNPWANAHGTLTVYILLCCELWGIEEVAIQFLQCVLRAPVWLGRQDTHTGKSSCQPRQFVIWAKWVFPTVSFPGTWRWGELGGAAKGGFTRRVGLDLEDYSNRHGWRGIGMSLQEDRKA